MDMFINSNELEALSGLPHWQQLTYLRGIRPYMDVQSGITGIKRKISHQSLTEQLYIEPHQGIKSESFSRAQVRRAVAALERVGLISNLSRQKQLILKCELATLGYYAQNKAVTNPSQKAVTKPSQQNPVVACVFEESETNPDHGNTPKADTPLYKDFLFYLSEKFERFWLAYPEKQARGRAWQTFQAVNPDERLMTEILNAIEKQKRLRAQKEAQGDWLPSWKHPANWLAGKCWLDEITIEKPKELKHATGRKSRKTTDANHAADPFCPPESTNNAEQSFSNVVSIWQ